jgi:hypothetical protein
MTFQLSFDRSLGGQTVHLAYLTNPGGADASSGTTWNGISYEENGDGTPKVVDETEYTLDIQSDGSLNVPVRDSSAVVVNLGGPVGQRAYNADACSSLSRSRPEALNPGIKTGQGTASSNSGSNSTNAKNANNAGARSSSSLLGASIIALSIGIILQLA